MKQKLIAHLFAEKWRRDIEKAAITAKYSIVALNDKQAVLVEGGKLLAKEKN